MSGKRLFYLEYVSAWHFLDTLIYTLGMPEKKFDALKAFSLGVIATYYPGSDWIHIYTDGSAYNGNTGAGLYCDGFFEVSFAVGFNASNFDVEIFAIRKSILNFLGLDTNLNKAVIFLDSQAAILAIVSYTLSDCFLVEETKTNLYNAITFGWENSFSVDPLPLWGAWE